MRQILQSQAAECSLACLAMVASAYGKHVELADLRRRFPISRKGSNLKHLVRQAADLGFTCRPLRLDVGALDTLVLPCILHWDFNHFVVLKRLHRGGGITIFDPARGARRLSAAEFSRHFTGVALELSPSVDFKPEEAKPRVPLRALTGRVRGIRRSMAQIFVLAAALELFAVTTPLLNQLVVDDAIVSHDSELLDVVVVGFGLMLLIQATLSLARGWMVMVLNQSLTLQWLGNVFSHLIKLPTSFFEQRHLGDIVSRFGAVRSIQGLLTTAVIEALLDGIMGVTAFVVMLLYAPDLAFVVLIAVLVYATVRWISWGAFREAASERLQIAAKENSHFLETLRAIQPLKLFGREQERRVRWQNLLVAVQNRDTQTAKLRVVFGVANSLVSGSASLFVLWLGAKKVIGVSNGGSTFTVGMLFAFMSYQAQFTSRVLALIDYAVDLKMLGLHSERLADIVLAKPEVDTGDGNLPDTDLSHLQPSLELRNVSFRYGEGEAWVLRHINLAVPAGSSIAITGPSGGGKTTLLKLMLGLLQPTEGEILYGGIPVRHLGLSNVRRQFGAVMQEDVLLAGTLSDNISFFDTDPDEERIQDSARLAMLHGDIVKMPMGYHTLVGDVGTGLSGGQKQRLLLARALYKNAKVLALDEATSHLDLSNEQQVTCNLEKLRVTRIFVAHRPNPVASAERVVQLKDGQLYEGSPVVSM